ncbi:putative defense protein 1 isoform X3 [Lethenteron reissneri]|uniref:putative defense protein 1 isoform X3 n=1 Tax=Lethenteron reissneri TaxID=7753 RepID=UPI002AB622A0|nr:putative defense protein 1 isoform X3 [Lethenteron reissneri]
MMEALLAVWMVGLVGLHGTQGFPGGAPSSSCTDMVPHHNPNTLTGTPYSIVTNSSTFTPGTKVKVTIQGTFKGYLLQAREPNTTTIVGTWDTPPAGNTILKCRAPANDAVTHSTGATKANLSFDWIPPTTNPPSSVVFVATVVKTEPKWQMNVQSAKVTASGYVATTTAKPGNSAGRAALAMSGFFLGALLVVVTAT